jgi:hypothetical protein
MHHRCLSERNIWGTCTIVVFLRETFGEHAPSYATVKNWVAQFKRGDFSTFFPLVGLTIYQHPGIPFFFGMLYLQH